MIMDLCLHGKHLSLKWFKYLFHLHEWETVKEIRLNVYDEFGKLEDTGTRYILRCKTCGHITKRDMI